MAVRVMTAAETRKRYVPEPPVCRICGTHGDLIQIKHIDEAEASEVIAEIRCANGHLQLQILKPGADAIALGRKLAERYRPGVSAAAPPEEPT